MKTVCVTGGAGYIASWLVIKLLQKGYTVHVTSRNLAQENVQALKNLPGADTQLKLFEADLFDEDAVLQAVKECYCVIHMATPFVQTLTGFENTADAAIAGVKCIVKACVKSGTAKRIIYTGSVTSCSPLKDAASSHSVYHDFMDESCWTSVGTEFPFADHFLLEYTRSKTVAEKEILKYNDIGEIEVVSLNAGLVGGDTLHSSFSGSLKTLSAQIRGDEAAYRVLRFIETVDGKIPIVHIEDVCNALVFCMDNPSVKGRFLCANGYLKTVEISDYAVKHYPSIHIPQGLIEDTQHTIRWGSQKLQNAGFRYKYDAYATLDETIKSAIRLGEVTTASLP